MKSLNEYVLEAGGFFGNTKTSKNDLIIDWLYEYVFDTPKGTIPSLYKVYDKGQSIEVIADDSINSYKKGNYRNSYIIGKGRSNSPALNGMPPVSLIITNPDIKKLYYKCEIKTFGVPLNIDDYYAIHFNKVSNMVKDPDIFNQTCKVINDCKSIKCIYFNYNFTSTINEHDINYKSYNEGFKELKRDFESISFDNALFHKINFNQNINIRRLNILRSEKTKLPVQKIISLPICKQIHFMNTYTYDEIIDMLSDYIYNPNIKNINIIADKLSLQEIENIKNIIFGKK